MMIKKTFKNMKTKIFNITGGEMMNLKLKDNIILTQHRFPYSELDLESMRNIKAKLEKYDTICFESDFRPLLNSQPQLIQIIDYYLFREAEILGKKIIWFNEYEEEMKEAFEYFEKIQDLNLTETENEVIQIKENEYIKKIHQSMNKKDFTKDELFKAYEDFTKNLNPKFIKEMEKMAKRDSKWNLSNNSVLYVFGANHGVNLNIWE